MEKRKLSKRQQTAIKKHQAEKRRRAEHNANSEHTPTGSEQTGLLVSHYGHQIEVEDNTGNIHRCVARNNLGALAVGDHVIWCTEKNGPDVIVAVEPRQTELYRYHKLDGNKLVAANIDQLYIVVAPEPSRAMNVLDRYIMLAEIQNIQPIIVFNKTDLLDDATREQLSDFFAYYINLGYPVFYTSIKSPDSITKLQRSLTQHCSIFVGLSGVGKSSLIKALLPHESIAIGELSERSREGNHTTTNAKLFHLADEGSIIDCPGIRELAVGNLTVSDVLRGFPDIAALAANCQFRNCSHQHEPGCAIINALENDRCNAARVASLKNILAEITFNNSYK